MEGSHNTGPKRSLKMNINSPDDAGPPQPGGVLVDIRHLTPGQLGRLGVSQIAYVKPVLVNGTPACGIFAADGSPMGVAPNAEIAIAAIREHEMAPTLVH
jgi:hypothetical protein